MAIAEFSPAKFGKTSFCGASEGDRDARGIRPRGRSHGNPGPPRSTWQETRGGELALRELRG